MDRLAARHRLHRPARALLRRLPHRPRVGALGRSLLRHARAVQPRSRGPRQLPPRLRGRAEDQDRPRGRVALRLRLVVRQRLRARAPGRACERRAPRHRGDPPALCCGSRCGMGRRGRRRSRRRLGAHGSRRVRATQPPPRGRPEGRRRRLLRALLRPVLHRRLDDLRDRRHRLPRRHGRRLLQRRQRRPARRVRPLRSVALRGAPRRSRLLGLLLRDSRLPGRLLARHVGAHDDLRHPLGRDTNMAVRGRLRRADPYRRGERHQLRRPLPARMRGRVPQGRPRVDRDTRWAGSLQRPRARGRLPRTLRQRRTDGRRGRHPAPPRSPEDRIRRRRGLP